MDTVDLDMLLSKDLTVREFVHTAKVKYQAEQAQPPPEILWNGRRHAVDLWQPVRDLWAVPVLIENGWRCPSLNAAVKGASDSLHAVGLATDNVPHGLALLDAMLLVVGARAQLALDLAILEVVGGDAWIHLQSPRVRGHERRLAKMTFDGVSYPDFDPNDARIPRAV